MKNKQLKITLISTKDLEKGDIFLWKSQITGKLELHTFHSDVGYGIKTFTDYNDENGSSLLVNHSGVCGKIDLNTISI